MLLRANHDGQLSVKWIHSTNVAQFPTVGCPLRFCITTLQPRLHSRSTRLRLFLAQISGVAPYFFCVYGLLEAPRLPATPRQYGNRRLVLAWSDWFRHLTYATSCRTSGLQTAEPSPANSLLNPQSLHIHDGGPGATAGTCIRRILIDTHLGAWLYSRHWSSTSRCCRRMGRNFCTLPKGSPKFSTFNGAL
jgi:hypothetical protein